MSTLVASGLNVKQESVTLVAGTQGSGGGQTEGGLKVVQVPGSNDFTVVPVDQGSGMTSTEVLQVVEAMPPTEGMIVAVPGSVGALEPDGRGALEPDDAPHPDAYAHMHCCH